jgi:RND family efflux transporter MFP subunit
MRHKTRLLFLRLISLAVLMMVLTGCSNTSHEDASIGYVTANTLTQTVESSGSVSAKQIATLKWSTSGNVLEVNVENNDVVASGQELMKLDSTSAPTDILEAISDLVTAQENLETAQVSKTSLAEAYQTLVDAQIAFEAAKEDYLMLDDPVAPEDFTASLKLAYINAQKATERTLRYYNQYSDNVESPDDPSYYPKFAAYAALCQARINEADALTRLTHFTNVPTQVIAEEVTGEYKLAQAKLDEAQRAYDEIEAGNVDAITSAQAAVDAAQATVNKLSIIAPFDGEVAVVYTQKGDVVSEGTSAMVLVDRSTLYVDVLVDEDTISDVSVGDSVEITLSALDITTTGKVAFVDPIGVSSSNVVNYTVRVDLDDDDPNILIGATATVVITTGDPKEYLYVPVTAVLMDEEGEYVTRIKDDGSTERVSVVTSDISDEKVVVTGDLIKGDMIQLFESSTSDSSDSSSNNRGGILGGLDRFVR